MSADDIPSSAITFSSVHADTPCVCAKLESPENCTDQLFRDLGSDEVKSEWFKSQWEDGQRPDHPPIADPPTKQDCRRVCDFKSVSMYISKATLDESRERTRSFNPSLLDGRTHYCVLKLRPAAGRFRRWDQSTSGHRHFYKADTFSVSVHVEVIAIAKHDVPAQ